MRNLLSALDLGAAEAAVTQAARIAVILLLAWALQRIASRLIQGFHAYMAGRWHRRHRGGFRRVHAAAQGRVRGSRNTKSLRISWMRRTPSVSAAGPGCRMSADFISNN